MSKNWFDDIQSPHPFVFDKKIDLHSKICSIEPFPDNWSRDSRNLWSCMKLFDPELAQELHSHLLDRKLWTEMIGVFKDALVVADDQKINIIWPSASFRPIQISLPELPQPEADVTKRINVAWALRPNKPYEPMVIFSYCRLIYIFNVRKRILEGCLRGHGGEITSLTVHPHAAHIFCTTSRDFTSRLYDLTREPQLQANNPPWPPLEKPSFAGPAHGLDMTTSEGDGIGRCVLVLMGGRSGGHLGEVFGAAFHDTLPVIATCGMDRTIKIWYIPLFSNRLEQKLLRDDKPLFGSSSIHKARVLSVRWLTHDTLLTHSAPARMRINPPSNTESLPSGSRQSLPDEPGSLTVWKWLSIDRFFPFGWDEGGFRPVRLATFKSDFQQSKSFRILSNYSFPPQTDQFITPMLYVCHGDPAPFVVISYPQSRSITFVNLALFKNTRTLTQSPSAANATQPLRYDEQVPGWSLSLNPSFGGEETVETCCMIPRSNPIIVAGGSKGSVWIFRAQPVPH
ncbi:WD40-repeat-containing domain protein [Lentinula raphanica]|nr:WD40-repeat-containing domain protein [Lentinula raphanica]